MNEFVETKKFLY